MRRTTALVIGVAAALMVAATPAWAAETVGSDLTATPDNSLQSGTSWVLTTAPTGSSLVTKASSAGVITSIRVKHGGSGADPGALTFRILNGAPPTFTARSHPRLGDFPAAANASVGEITIIPRDGSGKPQGVPIGAGEHVSLGQSGGGVGGGYLIVANTQSTGAVIAARNPTPDASDGALGWSLFNDRQVMLQYVVEPDADGDGYGDETQDGCFGVAQPTMVGTSASETIVGTPGNDVIASLGGDDLVRGLGGDDIICGGDGNDKLKGGAGKDTLYGEAGRDKLNGGGSKDRCFGGADKDAIGCEKAKQN